MMLTGVLVNHFVELSKPVGLLDQDGYYAPLLKFLQQPDISAKVGLRGRKWVESNRSWDRVALNVSEFVRGLVASRFLP